MKPIVLAILDGWGIGTKSQINPVESAQIPNFRKIEKNYPGCSLQASGIAIGLPWNEAGNSEVGHIVIGAGRVIYQYLPRISLEIKNGKFFNNPALLKAVNHAKKNNSALHLIGLASSGNVHSYLEHLYALIELARKEKIENLRLHLFTDGKDAPTKEGKKIIGAIKEKLNQQPNWQIASIIGRFFAMDRNGNWDRTEKTYNLFVNGIGTETDDPIKKMEEFYTQDINDTYIEPLLILDEQKKPVSRIQNNDAIIFFDFRADSMRQLVSAFVAERFENFARKKLENLQITTMTQYDKRFEVDIAYLPIEIKNNLAEELSKRRKRVLKVAETEKYAHVTYFFNGDREELFPYEDRKLISSGTVSRYDEKPEMQTEKVTDAVINGIRDKYDLIVVNYASPDIIAHTGNFEAATKSLEAIDKTLKRLLGMAEYGECILIITSDHGHIEQMVDLQTGETMTEHTLNPVPFFIVGQEFKLKSPRNEEELMNLYQPPKGIICDIAPTILELMQIPKPPEMTGESLLNVIK